MIQRALSTFQALKTWQKVLAVIFLLGVVGNLVPQSDVRAPSTASTETTQASAAASEKSPQTSAASETPRPSASAGASTKASQTASPAPTYKNGGITRANLLRLESIIYLTGKFSDHVKAARARNVLGTCSAMKTSYNSDLRLLKSPMKEWDDRLSNVLDYFYEGYTACLKAFQDDDAQALNDAAYYLSSANGLAKEVRADAKAA